MRSAVEGLMKRLKLPIYAEKTRCCRVPEEPMTIMVVSERPVVYNWNDVFVRSRVGIPYLGQTAELNLACPGQGPSGVACTRLLCVRGKYLERAKNAYTICDSNSRTSLRPAE